MPEASGPNSTPLLRRLQELERQYNELEQSLADPQTLRNSALLVSMTRRRGQMEPVVSRYRQYVKSAADADELRSMVANRSDPEMAEMAALELGEAEAKAQAQLVALQDEFLAAEDNSVSSFFLEIRAGTGGEEAALFTRDLFEVYRRYCEKKGWRFEVNDFSPSDHGGFKEVIVNVKAEGAYRRLRFEGGGHRVQRVPETEGQGRIHTSASTVAVLPEMPDVKIEINPKDVEEAGCRGGGPGGQNVNKVETGWRMLHKPTGLQFKMTEHRSQAQNRERAWALLRAALFEAEQAKQHASLTSARRAMMGSGDRNQRIRTYNFPQNRCTDHRLGGDTGGEKNFPLDKIMLGELDELIDALLELDRQQRLQAL